eukprot:2504314-Karenia_brevis.AAC.1
MLLKAAKLAREHSELGGEFFARGVFPAVDSLLPKVLRASEADIRWINQPASGRMSGLLFSDGSGLHPRWPELRRAGWAVVQVDSFGNLVAAAYGPVPWEEGPDQ